MTKIINFFQHIHSNYFFFFSSSFLHLISKRQMKLRSWLGKWFQAWRTRSTRNLRRRCQEREDVGKMTALVYDARIFWFFFYPPHHPFSLCVCVFIFPRLNFPKKFFFTNFYQKSELKWMKNSVLKTSDFTLSLSKCVCIYTHIYKYIHIYVCVYIYV